MSETVEDPHAEAGAKIGTGTTLIVGAAKLLMELRRKREQDRPATNTVATDLPGGNPGRDAQDAAQLARLINHAEAARGDATQARYREQVATPKPAATPTSTSATASDGPHPGPPADRTAPNQIEDATHQDGPTSNEHDADMRKPAGKLQSEVELDELDGKLRNGSAVAETSTPTSGAAPETSDSDRDRLHQQAFPAPTPQLTNHKPSVTNTPSASSARAAQNRPKPTNPSRGR